MSLNRYNAARDGNEKDIVKILRGMGLHVDLCDRPWDLCVTSPRGILSRWAEVKMPTEHKTPRASSFTKKQLETLKTWPGGHVDILWTVDSTIDFGQRLKRDERLLIQSLERVAA